MAGSILGLIAVHLGVRSKFLPVFIIRSLAGGLSSCVKAPVTSIVLTAELIGSFLHILPVAICSFVALFIPDLLHTVPIYEAMLNRFIEKHGYTIPFDDRPGELVEIPVEYDSEISGKLLRDIGWPKGSLIIGLHRGFEELIPKGETKIMPGDYLLIVTPKSDKQAIKQEMPLA